jgi:hypothetical protein
VNSVTLAAEWHAREQGSQLKADFNTNLQQVCQTPHLFLFTKMLVRNNNNLDQTLN